MPPPQPSQVPQGGYGMPQGAYGIPQPPQNVDFSAALPIAAMVGAGIAILNSIPLLGLLCCFWMLLGGAFAVMRYQKKRPGAVSLSGGAKLGALTGSFAFGFQVIFMALRAVFQMMTHGGSSLGEEIKQAIAQSASRANTAEAQRAFEWMQTSSGIAFVLVIGLGMTLFAAVLFTMLGGMIGASVSKK